MPINRRHLLLTMAACLPVSAMSAASHFPDKAIRVVVIVAPGGSGDTVTRMVGEGLRHKLGQPIVVENKPGAGGNVATQQVSRSPADGYTLLLSANNHTINPSLFQNPGYAVDDFIPVAGLMQGPSVLVVPADSPYQTLDELLAAARQKPERIAFGSAGIGTPSHIAGELLQRAAGVKLTHVAYRGSGPSLADVMGGQIPVAISTLVAAAGHIESGNLRALAVTSKKRWPSLPHIPAVSESAMPDYEHLTWLGLFAPKGTPAEITTLLNRQIRAVLSEPEMQVRISQMGGSVMLLNQPDFEESIARDYDNSTRLVRETQLKAD